MGDGTHATRVISPGDGKSYRFRRRKLLGSMPGFSPIMSRPSTRSVAPCPWSSDCSSRGTSPSSARNVIPTPSTTSSWRSSRSPRRPTRPGFKYVWVTEHHFLDEYSHLSANDVVLGYLAHATERVHIGSGIFNPLPQVNHPAKVAERVAMLDHLSGGRFEFGTGRGAGSHEILGFLPGMKDLSGTREIWEDVIGEFPKMWLQDEYEGYDGKYWSLPPRKVLPKPWGKPPPGHVVRGGQHVELRDGRPEGARRARVLGRAPSPTSSRCSETYKKAIGNAEPIGAFVNDNLMVDHGASCNEDAGEAPQYAVEPGSTTCKVTSSATTTPFPTRRGPGLAQHHPRLRPRHRRGAWRRSAP